MKVTQRLMLLTVALMLFGLYARAGSIFEFRPKAQALSTLQSWQIPQVGRQATMSAMSLSADGYENLTVNVNEPGTLGDELINAAIQAAGITDKTLITSLTVTGCLDIEDLNGYLCYESLNTLTSLKKIDLSGATVDDPYDAFCLFMDKIETIILPSNVKQIGWFGGDSITDITLPGTATHIWDGAFDGCPALVDIYCLAVNPPTFDIDEESPDEDPADDVAFDMSACTLHVPEPSVEAYRNAEGWKDMGNIVGFSIGELEDLTINVEEAGTLNDDFFDAAVAAAGITDKTLIDSLVVTGSLNETDIQYLKNLPNTLTYLRTLNLSGATVDYYGSTNQIVSGMFGGSNYSEIILPSTVSTISRSAFNGCSRLTSVTLPVALTNIQAYVFRDCPRLTDIYCMSPVPPECASNVWERFDKDACTVHVPEPFVEDYKNAAGWSEIGNIVGFSIGELEDLTINVEEAGTLNDDFFDAAVAAAGITDKTLIDSLVVTGSLNDDDLAYLKELPNSISYLRTLDLSGATIFCDGRLNYFYIYSANYSEIILPSTVTTVAGLQECPRLTSVTLPVALTNIRSYVFQDCPMLTDIYCMSTVPPECASNVWEGFDKDACTVHVPEPFVEDYKNAAGWSEIGNIVGFPIGKLEDLTINVEAAGTLDEELFDAAIAESGITDKTLIGSIKVTGYLDNFDLAYLSALTKTCNYLLTLDMSEAEIEGNAIGSSAFNSTGYQTIVLPPTLESIGDMAFAYSRLTNITLPESLRTIGAGAFYQSRITSIVIPDGVTELGEWDSYLDRKGTFSECKSLKSIKIGNGVTKIPDYCARGCRNLEEVTIGRNVVSLGVNALYPTVNNVYCYAKFPPVVSTEQYLETFYATGIANAVLHTYSNSASRYENAEGWSGFGTIVGDLGTYESLELTVNVDEEGTISEALQAAMKEAGISDMTDIGKLILTGSINTEDLNYIRDNMGGTIESLDLAEAEIYSFWSEDGAVLSNCAFEKLILPNTSEDMQEWNILSNCNNLKTLHIPDKVWIIGNGFLSGCRSLETVTGGAGIDGSWSDGSYFADCPNLKSPVILNTTFFRLPSTFGGAYEVPENVTVIAGDAMKNVAGLTSVKLPEGLTNIWGNPFDGTLTDIYCHAMEVPEVEEVTFEDIDKETCILHVYTELLDEYQTHEYWGQFTNIVDDLGAMPTYTPINEDDYQALCNIYNGLNGSSWNSKWITDKNYQSAKRWQGVTFDEDGYVTGIDLGNNGISGDLGRIEASDGLTHLKTLNLSWNALTGDVTELKNKFRLPEDCVINVELQDLGYIGEHTLQQLCNYGGLPQIAYYSKETGVNVSTLVAVRGMCKFRYEGTDDDNWGCMMWPNDAYYWGKFSWASPVKLSCTYPHRFTFTYKYDMGDANMDDVVNVLDLQSTLNYSNNSQSGLFNFHAADTYGPDDDINVQDIVATVNILLEKEDPQPALAKASGDAAPAEACVSVEDGEIVLYTTKPVAALDLDIAGIAPEQMDWEIEDMGFAVATAARADGTHAVIYSLQPRETEVGRTVLATFDAALAPRLASAVLSDGKASAVSVGTAKPTGISSVQTGRAAEWSITNVSGTTVMTGSNATEEEILRQARDSRLTGVFIISMDGARRKVVIR